MKLKVKHGKWGWPLSFAPIIPFLGYVVVLTEPLQAKYAGNHLESPSIAALVIATLVLALFSAVSSFLGQALLSVKEEASPETEVDTTFTFKQGGKAFAAWLSAWIFVFGVISIVWYGQL